MFKRIISALVCLLFTVCGFAAKLTATLQSGDKITPFYGDNAFVDAYNAAVNGDVITLSPGAFKATNIEKSITVIGAYAFSEDLSKTTQFSSPVSISGDNVTLEGVRFVYTLMIEGTDNLIVNRCWIDYLNATQKEGHKYHNNTILTDCYIDDNFAMPLSQNMVLRNCSVNHFNEMNEIGNPALIENCNVTLFAYHNIGVSYHQPYAIYRNCLLGLYKTVRYDYPPSLYFYAPSELHNNCFYETYEHPSTPSNAKSWSIQYGSAHSNNINVRVYSSTTNCPANGSFAPYTKDGVSYGPINHKEYPAVPSITSSEIDTQTDANGNLHVKITATARD